MINLNIFNNKKLVPKEWLQLPVGSHCNIVTEEEEEIICSSRHYQLTLTLRYIRLKYSSQNKLHMAKEGVMVANKSPFFLIGKKALTKLH